MLPSSNFTLCVALNSTLTHPNRSQDISMDLRNSHLTRTKMVEQQLMKRRLREFLERVSKRLHASLNFEDSLKKDPLSWIQIKWTPMGECVVHTIPWEHVLPELPPVKTYSERVTTYRINHIEYLLISLPTLVTSSTAWTYLKQRIES